jgi:hypothetical protein
MDNIEKLINEKFNTVNTKLDSIGKRLDHINGSVQRHEKEINNVLIERAFIGAPLGCASIFRCDELNKVKYLNL